MLATISGSVDQELLLRNEYLVTDNRIRAVKTELLSKMILFGESSFRHCLENYVNHFHAERNHQGKSHVIWRPTRSIWRALTCEGGRAAGHRPAGYLSG